MIDSARPGASPVPGPFRSHDLARRAGGVGPGNEKESRPETIRICVPEDDSVLSAYGPPEDGVPVG